MPKPQKISPFLWFDDNAEEAVKHYVSIFKKSKITSISRYGEAGPGKKGSVMTVGFRLEGQDFTALNGGPHYKFTPAISFVVTCKTQKEIDDLWRKLGRGGQSQRCGWMTDRFGVSWQIVPEKLGELLKDEGAMKAMLEMDKLDIQRLKDAAGKGSGRQRRR